MFRRHSFKGGLELHFLPSKDFESFYGMDPEKDNPTIARNILRLLMMGASGSWQDLITWPIFRAVFIYRDSDLLKELRFAFQQGFEYLFTQLQGKKLNKEETEQFQLYLSNCLSLLPFSDITPYESIKIPQFLNDEWELVEYHIVPIELTHQTGIRKFFVQDED
ncbi:MAG: hypothetical protein ACHP6H_05020, partial [Legionellales bacterium]